MDKGVPSSLFVNDGSFLERFKQLQQEQEKEKNAKLEDAKPIKVDLGSLSPNPSVSKTSVDLKASDTRKTSQAGSSGKLAFSLKQKSKLVPPPVKLSDDEDVEETDAGDVSNEAPMKRQKLGQEVGSEQSSKQLDVGGASTSSSKQTNGSQRSSQQNSSYQTPASALYESAFDPRASGSSLQSLLVGSTDEPNVSSNADSLALMEFYMKKAAREERLKQPKQSKDEIPPPPSLQGKKGHHMGDFIPLEELDKFLAACNDAAAQRVTREAAERARIQADNVGHKLLSKMGWKEGEGLGGSRKGISDPIMAGNVKKNNLGVGAHEPGEVTPDDDIYEQYKKRMMLGYRYRPNPLNNPRKAYY